MTEPSFLDFFVLLGNVGGEEIALEILGYSDSKLYDVTFHQKIEAPFVKWHIKIADQICEIESIMSKENQPIKHPPTP